MVSVYQFEKMAVIAHSKSVLCVLFACCCIVFVCFVIMSI